MGFFLKTRVAFSALLLMQVMSPCFVRADSPLAYETVKVPTGSYELFIPLQQPDQVVYLRKKVHIKHEIEIGKYEVTNAQWSRCYREGGCSHPAEVLAGEGDSHPIARVNWHDAYQFSRWLTAHSAYYYRLPTEEEWAYAMYAGQSRKEPEITYDYSDVSAIQKIVKLTEPGGAHGLSAWGFADATGNVWEWTLTCWYGSEENTLAEHSVVELNDPRFCSTRIAMGENRSHIPDFIKDTYSGGCATLRPAANLGFRLVKEAKVK